MLGYTDRNLVSTLNLTFEGSRDDLPIRPTSLGFHDLNPIQLKADSPSVPNFNYLNGSDIYFANITGDWYVAATPITVPPCTTFGQGLCTSPTETLSISKSTAGVGRGSTGNFVEMLVVVTVAVSILGA
ncbi:hypothetical protein GQ53DRAFT_4135 [Thozetella sp. PMI_491]|nr:hypothetical protein GQ53DRAFT_4135 [Thozetella sp. PMI_491]